MGNFANLLNFKTEGKRGRPRGSGKKAGDVKKRAMSLKEKNEVQLTRKQKEMQKEGEALINEVIWRKKRGYKDKWEIEKEFREKYLNGGLKVRESMVLNIDQKFLKYNDSGDIEYKPF